MQFASHIASLDRLFLARRFGFHMFNYGYIELRYLYRLVRPAKIRNAEARRLEIDLAFFALAKWYHPS
jgi:hypothetical protein